MQEWNAVINVNERGLKDAFAVLGRFGFLKKTGFRNVLLMNARDVRSMLAELRELQRNDPVSLSFLSRLIPATHIFSFQSPGEFEEKARETVTMWVSRLAGKRFHVRMRRRGFKGKLSSLDEERFLDIFLLECLEKAGTPGHITFDDPDEIIAVETVAAWAGLSIWSREEMLEYPFIRLD